MTLVSLKTSTSPRPQQLRQVERLRGRRQLLALDQQQPRRIARARGPQGDAVGGKVEVEKVDAHQPPDGAAGASGVAGAGSRPGAGAAAGAAALGAAPMLALTILVGWAGGSPTAMASTAAMPSITRPNAVYL